MKLTNDMLVKDRYDVVVVGAGIGGLTAAALLAKRGLQVLLVEQHYLPGGCCGAIRRHDVTMDVGSTVLYGFGEKGYNVHRFVMNELEEPIDMIPREAIYHMHVGDKRIVFWRDFDAFFRELLALFPSQRVELKHFYDTLFKLYQNTILQTDAVVPPTEMTLGENLRTFLRNPLGTLKLMRMMFQSAEEVFQKFFKDPEILAFFDMLTRTFSYVDADQCPGILSVTMFVDNHVGGAYYPAGSPQMLSNRLESAFERYGGQLLYRHLVDEILMENGQAFGVRLGEGTEVRAERVVSDATVWNLYGKLVKPRHIKPKRMKWAQSFIPTHSNLILYIAADAEAMPVDARPMEIIIEDMHEVAGHGVTVFLPTLIDPTVSPPGACSITVTAVSDSRWPSPSDPAYQSEEYKRRKQQEADKLLDRMAGRFPNLKKHIRQMEIATPTTLERFTLKNWGNVGGPRQMIGQEMMKRLKARSEWKNLYLCGDSTVMGIGVLPATTSGVGAANMVLRDLGLEEYKSRPFARQFIRFIKGQPWEAPPAPSEPVTQASAAVLAKECQLCEKPGCTRACPAGIDVLAFTRRIEAGNLAGAARSLHETNPLAEVCGHICPAERLCQKECNRLEFSDHPVRIADLHAWVCAEVSTARGWNHDVPAANGFRVAVVGAGPAGLTCAHFLARLGYRVDLLEKAEKPGGMLAQALPVFRLSEAVVEREIQGLTLPFMQFRFGQALGWDVTVEELARDHEAVFLAPGLWSGRRLELEGGQGVRAVDALGFLCAFRERGQAEVGREVLVIGGGSVAMDAALAARRCGAEKVSLVCLEKEAEMPALAGEVAELRRQGVEICNGWGPRAFVSANRVSLVGCTSVFDSEGRFAPCYDESRTLEKGFDQLIWAVGQSAEPFLEDYLQREFGFNGRLQVDPETLQVVGRRGVFAGGDIVRGAGTVVQAVADGRRAAKGIHALLRRT